MRLWRRPNCWNSRALWIQASKSVPNCKTFFVALSAAEEVEERDERQPKRERERERPIKITRRVTIDQALRDHRHLMILGDPGAGKSTLLRYLALVAAQGVGAIHESSLPEPCLPILIRLSSFARSGQSFVEYFETFAKTQLHVSLGEKFFERALEEGQAIVCLDGLDEVSNPHSGSKFGMRLPRCPRAIRAIGSS